MIASKTRVAHDNPKLKRPFRILGSISQNQVKSSLKSMVSDPLLLNFDIHFEWSNDRDFNSNLNRPFDLILLDDSNLLELVNDPKNNLFGTPISFLYSAGYHENLESEYFQNVSDFLCLEELSPASFLQSIHYSLKLGELQKKLKNQNDQYQQFIENNRTPIFIVETESFKILQVNQAAVDQYGYSSEEFSNLTILDIRPKEDIPHLLDSFKTNTESTDQYKTSARHITKRGELIDVEVRSTAININGKSARLALVENISEQLKTEQAHRTTERRFKALVQEGMDIIAVISEDARHLYISPSVERVLGFSQEEYMGMNVYDFLHPEDIPKIKKTFEALIKSKEPVSIGPFRVKNAFGEWRYLESRFTNQLHDPAIMGLVSTSRDITDQVEFQAQLEQSKDRFENIAQLTNDLIYEFDPFSQQMTIITSGRQDIYDCSNSKNSINRLDWEARMHPQDRDEMLQYLHQMFNGKHRLESIVEYRFQKPDGKYAHIQDSFKTIKKDDLTFIIQGSIQDISLRKMHGALLSFEKDMLTLYAKNQNAIGSLLNKALKTLEDLIEGAMCSVLKLESDNTVRHMCAPTLPSGYLDGINGLPIGPIAGSCGTAMHHGKTIIVTDIPNDPLWEPYAEFAARFDLKACWSVPIKSQSGKVLGSFATYYHNNRKPDYFELETISRAAGVLGIILENFQAREDLKKLNERYDIVALATSDLIWEYDPVAKKVMIDEVLFEKFGYAREDNYSKLKWWINHLHKTERFKTMRTILSSLKLGKDEINQELSFRAANGEYRQLLTRIFIVRDENGKVSRAIGAMEDITQREKHLKEIEHQNIFLKELSWDQSHNVRAPLARIMGLTDLLGSFDAPNEEFKRIISYLLDSSQELDNIVRNVIRKLELMKKRSP